MGREPGVKPVQWRCQHFSQPVLMCQGCTGLHVTGNPMNSGGGFSPVVRNSGLGDAISSPGSFCLSVWLPISACGFILMLTR